MEKTLIVANWKENFTAAEAERWVGGLNEELRIKNKGGVEIVVCPPFVLTSILHSLLLIPNSPFRLGAQDVSKFEGGQYTGEVSAKMLKDFVSYVIVGHSERRKYFGETNEDVGLKIEQCLKHDLAPIVCVSNLEQASASQCVNESNKIIFVYEPVEAISTGGEFHPDDPEHAQVMAKEIKAVAGQDIRVLYGGSVTSENVKSFVSQPDINGVLVGQASLDAGEFTKICDEIC